MRSDSELHGVVFTDGVFDLLHSNHVEFLQEASTFGSRLVVGVVSDKRTQQYKRQTVVGELDRLLLVKALRCVDHAFIIHQPMTGITLEQIIQEYQVAAVVYAGDATPDFYRPAEEAGIMHRLPYRTGINTTEIIDRVLERFS
jgi:cytidyltransferase-like protein